MKEEIEFDFPILEKLNQCDLREVYRIRDQNKQNHVIVKSFQNVDEFNRELYFLKLLNDENFIKLVDFDQNNRKLYFEDGGKNFDDQSYEKSFSEKEVLELFKGVFYALKFLHDRNIFHGDVKLQNMVTNPRTKKIALIDFDLSEELDPQYPYSSEEYGTLLYIAPETHKGEKHGLPADIYAAGVSMFILLKEDFPYEFNLSYTEYAIHQMNDDVDIKALENKGISLKTCKLLSKMLSRNPNERPTIDEIIKNLYN